MSNATATHAVLCRSGRPIRVAALTDWQALADMRSAASMSIGIYTVAEVDARAAQDAEDIIAGTRAALRARPAARSWRTRRARRYAPRMGRTSLRLCGRNSGPMSPRPVRCRGLRAQGRIAGGNSR